MSWWTYVHGSVVVSPMGRTQAEKRYILDTVLNHLPIVSGSEGDMDVYVIQKNGISSSGSSDEFGECTNNLIDRYGRRSQQNGWLNVQDEYILVVDGALRNREFDQTFREFMKWICRLAKRVDIKQVQVKIKGWNQSVFIQNPNINRKGHWDTVFGQMFETPTWCQEKNDSGEPNWCEYLMYDTANDSHYPMLLAYKYFSNEENDKEVERRLKYNNDY